MDAARAHLLQLGASKDALEQEIASISASLGQGPSGQQGSLVDSEVRVCVCVRMEGCESMRCMRAVAQRCAPLAGSTVLHLRTPVLAWLAAVCGSYK